MKSVIVGAHLHRNDIEPDADAVPVADLFLSAVPLDDAQPLGDRDLLIRVAEIRGRLLDRATFIAIRYGLSIRGSEEAAEKCGARVAAWRQLLTVHRDNVEMTLKAVAATTARRPDRREFASGAEYLRALQQATQAVDVDPAFRNAVERLLVPLAVQARWSRGTSSLELAMLVRRRDLEAVNLAGERLRDEFRSIPFLLSGPWPLEVFADADQQ